MVQREMLWTRDGEDTAALPLLIELLRYGSARWWREDVFSQPV